MNDLSPSNCRAHGPWLPDVQRLENCSFMYFVCFCFVFSSLRREGKTRSLLLHLGQKQIFPTLGAFIKQSLGSIAEQTNCNILGEGLGYPSYFYFLTKVYFICNKIHPFMCMILWILANEYSHETITTIKMQNNSTPSSKFFYASPLCSQPPPPCPANPSSWSPLILLLTIVWLHGPG